ncbi:MAG: bifunctional 5,10-methylenetetrahydrofolate dehydrogenase/5,10-methenyltetrahydrofolate cyclohydrolase [Patescibacteria group bacterium]|jgi:methylenetetrahydrofolate dehydrogenase (NADP+)/methenyltetrahydrofolate cyclohydrolase
MTAKLLLGQPVADQIYADIKFKLTHLPRPVHIAAILIGDDMGSVTYLRMKEKRCAELGIGFTLVKLAQDIKTSKVESEISKLNADEKITGVIVQLPLPKHLDQDYLLKQINPKKDIDAFGYLNSSDAKNQIVYPPTPTGMLKLCEFYDIDLKNQKIVVIGDGLLVGLPLHRMLCDLGFGSMLINNSDAPQSRKDIIEADVIFCGVGKADLITPEMIKNGVVIIDAGYSKVSGQTRGDADPECEKKASAITPPVGGVGPLTVACLLLNAVKLVEIK